MNDLLDTAIFPMAFFVKIAPVGRTTLENWMRSGALAPAQEGESSEGPLAVFGGKKFSVRNLFKIEVMFRLARFGISPSAASGWADRAASDFETVADELYRAFKSDSDGDFKSAYLMQYSHESEQVTSLEDFSPIQLLLPIGGIARVCFAKLDAFLIWSEVELPKLREQISAHASKLASQ